MKTEKGSSLAAFPLGGGGHFLGYQQRPECSWQVHTTIHLYPKHWVKQNKTKQINNPSRCIAVAKSKTLPSHTKVSASWPALISGNPEFRHLIGLKEYKGIEESIVSPLATKVLSLSLPQPAPLLTLDHVQQLWAEQNIAARAPHGRNGVSAVHPEAVFPWQHTGETTWTHTMHRVDDDRMQLHGTIAYCSVICLWCGCLDLPSSSKGFSLAHNPSPVNWTSGNPRHTALRLVLEQSVPEREVCYFNLVGKAKT